MNGFYSSVIRWLWVVILAALAYLVLTMADTAGAAGLNPYTVVCNDPLMTNIVLLNDCSQQGNGSQPDNGSQDNGSQQDGSQQDGSEPNECKNKNAGKDGTPAECNAGKGQEKKEG